MKGRLSQIQNKQNGFTLAELIITVAIVGILAGLAYFAYDVYTIRGQVSESFTISANYRIMIEEYYANNGELPAGPQTFGINTIPLGKYSYPTIGANGEVEVVFGNKPINPNSQNNVKIDKLNLSFLPVIKPDGSIHWSCGGGDTNLPNIYRPSSCTNN